MVNQQLVWQQQKQKRLNVCKRSKNSVMFTLSLGLFEKVCQQQQHPNTYFFFQKKSQKVGLRTNGKFFFLFVSSITKKKRILRDKFFFFFFEQKYCDVSVKNKSLGHSKNLKFFFVFLCFYVSGNKNTFPFLCSAR